MDHGPKITVTLFMILLGIVFVPPLKAQSDVPTKPYTSTWGDFKTVVPDGWANSSYFDGTNFTEISFKSPEPNFSLLIRWYKIYGTFTLPNRPMQMYSSIDNYIDNRQELTKNSGKWTMSDGTPITPCALVEPVHDVDQRRIKAKRFVIRSPKYSDDEIRHLGSVGLPSDDIINAGEYVYTVVPTSSGFYALVYFTPQGGSEEYGKLYDQMVSSFELIKDGPGGSPLQGKTATEVKPDEVLQQLVSQFQSQKDILYGSTITRTEWSHEEGRIEKNLSGWFADTPLSMEKKIIEFVSSMNPPPAIPDEAMRNFVKAVTYMKDAKDVSDYQTAIEAFEKALFNAPWWGDAYYNLGIAFESVGRYDDAIESIKVYLLTNPPSAAEDKKKIYAIEAKREKATQERKNSEDLLKKINGARFVYRSHGTIAMTGAPADFMDTLDVSGDTITVGQGLASGQDWSANGGITYKIEGQKVHCFANGKAIPQGDGILADDGSTIRIGDHIYQRER